METRQVEDPEAEAARRGGRPEARRRAVRQRIEDKERDAEALREELRAIDASAEAALKDSREVLDQLVGLLESRRGEVRRKITLQRETEVGRVRALQEELELEIARLKLPSGGEPPLSSARPPPARPRRYFEGVTAALTEARDQLLDLLRDARTDLSADVPEPGTRAGFLKFSRQITLDPDSANTWLLLSNGDRRVTFVREQQPYGQHRDRFADDWQVLSREGLSGRCYWEVDWSGWRVYIAVAYRTLSRAGEESEFGWNDKSWALDCNQERYKFWHNKVQSVVSGPRPSRVGVYLDHRAGVLAFYSVGGTMTLLHRVQTTFTQPLHAGLGLNYAPGATAEFVRLKHNAQ